MPKKYQFLIVGSGAGGATLARELSKQDKNILLKYIEYMKEKNPQ